MDAQLLKAYKQERREIVVPNIDDGALVNVRQSANHALRSAKTRQAWQEREASDIGDPEAGQVRLRILPDEVSSVDDLLGDIDLPKWREKQIERINRDGACGIVGEYFDGEEWQQADSVWGFIGDDWQNSGYDVDIMQSALDKATALKMCPTCGRPQA